MRNRFFVGEVADLVVRNNKDTLDFERNLLDIIPDKLLNTEFNSGNIMELSRQLDKLRHAKEKELATLTSHQYYSAVQDQQRLSREIKFLAAVGVTLLHW